MLTTAGVGGTLDALSQAASSDCSCLVSTTAKTETSGGCRVLICHNWMQV